VRTQSRSTLSRLHCRERTGTSKNYRDQLVGVRELAVDDRAGCHQVRLDAQLQAGQSSRHLVGVADERNTCRNRRIPCPSLISPLHDVADAQLLDRLLHVANAVCEERALEVLQHFHLALLFRPIELGVLLDLAVEHAKCPPHHLSASSPFCLAVQKFCLVGTPGLQDGITSSAPGALEDLPDEGVDFLHGRTLL
jgi:hypothetical protein